MHGVNLNKGISNNSQANLDEVEGKLPNKDAQKTGSVEKKKGMQVSLKTKFANFKAMITGRKIKESVEESLNTSKQLKGRNTGAATKNVRKEDPDKLLIRYAQDDSASAGSQKQSQPVAKPKDSPPPYSLHDPLNSSKGMAPDDNDSDELDALLDDLDDLVKQAPEKSATTFKNENTKNSDNLLDETLQTLTDSPPPYSLHDPLDISKGPPPPSYIPSQPTQQQLDGKATNSKDIQSLQSAIYKGLTQALQGERGSLITKEDIQKFSENLSISLGLKPESDELSLDQFSALVAMKTELESFLPHDVKSKFDALILSEEIRLMNNPDMT